MTQPIARTTLINVSEMTEEFAWAFGDEAASWLLNAEGEEVEVLNEATDGYWDIKLANGAMFDAVSWYHLAGFTEDTTTFTETRLVNLA